MTFQAATAIDELPSIERPREGSSETGWGYFWFKGESTDLSIDYHWPTGIIVRDLIADTGPSDLPVDPTSELVQGHSLQVDDRLYYTISPTSSAIVGMSTRVSPLHCFIISAGVPVTDAINRHNFERIWGKSHKSLYGASARLSLLTQDVPSNSGSDLEILGSSASHQRLHLALERAFREARDEFFEDGMESSFSSTLKPIIQKYGDNAVAEIDRILASGKADIEVEGEVLRQLGLVEHESSRQHRLGILLRYIRSDVIQFRDAASIGLSALDDPAAIPALREAVEDEGSPLLRQNLQLVLSQLEDTQRWSSS